MTPAAEKDPVLHYVEVTEQKRLNEAREKGIPWKKWGPYLSERQWGTVREDYSTDGNAWAYFSHDQSRSRWLCRRRTHRSNFLLRAPYRPSSHPRQPQRSPHHLH